MCHSQTITFVDTYTTRTNVIIIHILAILHFFCDMTAGDHGKTLQTWMLHWKLNDTLSARNETRKNGGTEIERKVGLHVAAN